MAHSLAVTKSCPDIKFHVCWYVIELHEFNDKKKKKKMDKMGELFLVIILAISGVLVNYLAYSLVLTCVVL